MKRNISTGAEIPHFLSPSISPSLDDDEDNAPFKRNCEKITKLDAEESYYSPW